MFDYFVSLGVSCPTASSMAKYGLRAFSGPFDWLITDNFGQVLRFIESDFNGFLNQENLKQYGNIPGQFVDVVSGFIFLHEQVDWRNDLSILIKKYNRRIKRFIQFSTKRICYLRSVTSKQELEYIQNNEDYIRSVITNRNPESEIVFLLKKELPLLEALPFLYFRMPGDYSTVSRQALRAWFDDADDFLEFCGKNFSAHSMIKNIAIDQEKNQLIERRYITLTKLLSYDFSTYCFSKKTIIYGAGNIGQELCRKIRSYTQIVCFIDKSIARKEVLGIPVVDLPSVECMRDTQIIVSAAYDYAAIKEKICDGGGGCIITSIDSILGLQF